jgi:hypothetical protein
VCDKIASEAIINACMWHERVDECVERLRHEGTLSASESESRVDLEWTERKLRSARLLSSSCSLRILLYCPRGLSSHRFVASIQVDYQNLPGFFEDVRCCLFTCSCSRFTRAFHLALQFDSDKDYQFVPLANIFAFTTVHNMQVELIYPHISILRTMLNG